ncbi:MAG: DoxX family protein [Flavobacteriaceae bacterium]|nr:DoxX family protein [Flavobacteriaceae bacterium]
MSLLQESGKDFGLLILRVFFSLFMIFGHGWNKLVEFPRLMDTFPDPLGIGPMLSLSGAVFAEVICSILILLGVKTRFFAVPAFITMMVVALLVLGNDPFVRQEKALLYAVVYLVLIIAGGGKFSVRD